MPTINPILPEEDFRLLWKINPHYDNPDHDYDNTYNLLVSILSYPKITPDGINVDFVLIYERFKQYIHNKTLAQEGMEKRYIPKTEKIKTLHDYLWDSLFMSEEKLPVNSMHYYFWGESSKEEIVELHKKFQRLCAR